MMTLKSNLTKIFNYLKANYLIILGFLIISIYFWQRFIKTRVSKDLPFNLSVLGLFVLMFICTMYAITIYMLIKSPKTNPILEKLVDWLFTPLKLFDQSLKTSTQFKQYLISFCLVLKPVIVKSNIFYTVTYIIPRIILVIVLSIDIYWFHKIYYFYYFILLGLLPFLGRYIIYSFKQAKKKFIIDSELWIRNVSTLYMFGVHPEEWPENIEETLKDPDYEVGEIMYLSTEIYINFQTQYFITEGFCFSPNDEQIGVTEYCNEYYHKQFKLSNPFDITSQQLIIIQNNMKKIINEILELSLLIEYYNISSSSNQKIKTIKILIFLNYLLCWLSVLIYSLETFNIYELIIVLIKTFLMIPEPFSGIIL